HRGLARRGRLPLIRSGLSVRLRRGLLTALSPMSVRPARSAFFRRSRPATGTVILLPAFVGFIHVQPVSLDARSLTTMMSPTVVVPTGRVTQGFFELFGIPLPGVQRVTPSTVRHGEPRRDPNILRGYVASAAPCGVRGRGTRGNDVGTHTVDVKG